MDAPPAVLSAPCNDPLPERALQNQGQVIWADPERVAEPSVSASLEWALMQLLPSPEWGFGTAGSATDGTTFGFRWQLTPWLYSFATDPRLSRQRWFVVEPVVRHSGSIELFISPEYVWFDGGLGDRLGGRVGVRSYFGLMGRGDDLSLSLGTSYVHFSAVDAVAYEAGAYVLFGMLGLQLEYAPSFEAMTWTTSLRLRFF